MLKSVLKFLIDIFSLQKLHQKVIWRCAYTINMLIHACSVLSNPDDVDGPNYRTFQLLEMNQND